jgi:hypothetical protein
VPRRSISSYRDRVEDQKFAPDLAFEPLQRFPNATKGDETYVVYRVTQKVEGN